MNNQWRWNWDFSQMRTEYIGRWQRRIMRRGISSRAAWGAAYRMANDLAFSDPLELVNHRSRLFELRRIRLGYR